MKKVDKIMYIVGCVGILITAFATGWNYDHFMKD